MSSSALHSSDPSPFTSPHLSHAHISKYLHCPEQYRLYYLERLRPRLPAATLVFGQVVHEALAAFFRSGVDPHWHFAQEWQNVRNLARRYGARESWEKLDQVSTGLLARFLEQEVPRLRNIRSVEAPFELSLGGLDLPFVGIIDLVADLDGTRTVVDFKTASSTMDAHEASLSDQLSAYQLAEPEAEQAALCVLVKTKEHKIEWHLTARTGDQLRKYLSKVGLVARDITLGQFYKRPGKWCSWCEFLPVCIGDQETTDETLVRIQ